MSLQLNEILDKYTANFYEKWHEIPKGARAILGNQGKTFVEVVFHNEDQILRSLKLAKSMHIKTNLKNPSIIPHDSIGFFIEGQVCNILRFVLNPKFFKTSDVDQYGIGYHLEIFDEYEKNSPFKVTSERMTQFYKWMNQSYEDFCYGLKDNIKLGKIIRK